jgi:hypothetical protein
VSPHRRRLGRAYRRAVAGTPRARRARFKAHARDVARGVAAELYDGHQEDARIWLFRKYPAVSETPPWGAPRCPCCGAAPCDGSRLGCSIGRSRFGLAIAYGMAGSLSPFVGRVVL